MSYIDRNLIEGERVVYRTRLHWLVFATPLVVTIVVLLPASWFLLNSLNWQGFA